MTKENDIVLIYIENIPVSFARVESILADSKKDWYHIKLLFLQIPLQVVTWILKDTYINGEEFSMGGKKMKLERVKCPEDETIAHENSSSDKLFHIQNKNNRETDISDKKRNKKIQTQGKQADVISLADIRKSKNKK